ncbi:hypothetical protein FIBSPDRAFT_838462 [Athelia psychrophila]|uniref:ditrans,polycis-polyprenyl diphosphate synthase [(2E,6E)-farnesyldiphosphate specific] n=1 Tax=Athelia psychrophila TaxID=1759441 RepID=A0A165ZGS6_9AGAM|nr:hypothetical protein FIBSPDRAFT_838462 [Fibularhizoctonia sp. CBS 109695]
MLASLCLHIFHCLYSLATAFSHFWSQLYRREPHPLNATRTKIPSHLAIVLVANECIDLEALEASVVETVARAASWCRAAGIKELTVYDAEGIALQSSQQIRECLLLDQPHCDDDTDSEVEYPLTPPLSETSGSRPISPAFDAQLGLVTLQVSELRAPKPNKTRHNVVKRRRNKDPKTQPIPLTLNLVSREASKPTIASITRSYARNAIPSKSHASSPRTPFEISSEDLGMVLEGRSGLAPPTLMIVHHMFPPSIRGAPLELHGYPPWQLQLTEIYSSQPAYWASPSKPALVSEDDFRAALDEFSGAEMRLGK